MSTNKHSEWVTERLGAACELIKRGIAPKYLESGGFRVVNQKCVRGHTVNFDLARRNDTDKKRVPDERVIRAGDVLVNSTGTGTLGRVAQLRTDPNEPTTVDTHVTIVRPKVDRFYLPFFGYMMIAIEDQLISGGHGTSGQTELPRSDLENKYFVSYPTDLEEQRRIVEVLDKAFEGLARARTNAETNLANAQELFNSALKQVFDFRSFDDFVVPLSKIAKITSSRRVMKTDYVESGVPFFRTKEVKQLSNGKPITTELFIARSHYAELKNRYGVPTAGDVLLTAIGTIGETYVVQEADEFYFKDGNVLWLKDLQNISPHFLRYSLMNFSRELQSLSHGAAYNALPIEKLKSHKMRVPEMQEQIRQVQKLDIIKERVQQLEKLYERKLSEQKAVGQSLLQKAFAGELI